MGRVVEALPELLFLERMFQIVPPTWAARLEVLHLIAMFFVKVAQARGKLTGVPLGVLHK